MHVFINILCWNDERYLPDLFASLERQTFKGFTVRLLDNGSTDGSVDYLREHHSQALVVRNVRNLGFAPGHNQLMRLVFERAQVQDLASTGILVMNPDMILKENAVEELVKALEADQALAAVQPKLLRAFQEHVATEGEGPVKSDILDTTGLTVGRGWRMTDRGAGEVDRGQYDTQPEIFGPTGTMALFRASELAKVMVQGEVFDSTYFFYREDCDLAWRLHSAGLPTRFVPTAVAHHYRGMYGAERRSLVKRLFDRRQQRPLPAAYSTRNQLFTLLKNITWGEFFRAFPLMFFQEGGRVLYGFLFEPETRKLLLQAPRLVPEMLRKRREVQSLRRL